MQLSQLYRRGVLRPLDDCATQQLSEFRVESSTRVEWLPILNDDDFASIWQTGILQKINDACGIEISDYEETELLTDKIERARQVLRSDVAMTGAAVPFFQKLDALLAEALATNNKVYFVL